jgi:hypothetical protein
MKKFRKRILKRIKSLINKNKLASAFLKKNTKSNFNFFIPVAALEQ